MLAVKSSLLETIHSVKHGFYSRIGGCSPLPHNDLNASFSTSDPAVNVSKNRKIICRDLLLSNDIIYTAQQVHGCKIYYVDDQSPREIQQTHCDALWTDKKNLTIGVLTADCVPILLTTKCGSVVAAIHAGWRGIVDGVIENSVKQIANSSNINPNNFLAAIGPSISVNAFEVNQDCAEKIINKVGSEKILQRQNNQIYISLQLSCQIILHNLGVISVDGLNICTYTNNKQYFSHRKQKDIGRQISVICKM